MKINLKNFKEMLNKIDLSDCGYSEIWKSRIIKDIMNYLKELSFLGVNEINLSDIIDNDNYSINRCKILNGSHNGESLIEINGEKYNCEKISSKNYLKIIDAYNEYPFIDTLKKDKNNKIIIEDKFIEKMNFLYFGINDFLHKIKKTYNKDNIIIKLI